MNLIWMTVSCDLSRWWRQEGRRNYFGNAIYPIVHCTQPTKNELYLSCHLDSSLIGIVQKTVLYFPKSIMILFCQQLYGFIVPVHWNLKIIRKSCRWYQRSPTLLFVTALVFQLTLFQENHDCHIQGIQEIFRKCKGLKVDEWWHQ